MAGFFKKKKRGPIISKNEQKIRRGDEAERRERSFGIVAERYPNIAKVRMEADFLSIQGQLIGHEEKTFTPKDPCIFIWPCAGRCGKGTFNWTMAVEDMLNANKEKVESFVKCQEYVNSGSHETCGCEMRYSIQVTYLS